MNFVLLVIKEALYRRTGTLLILLSVILAVASLAASFTLLKAHDNKTEELIAAKEIETEDRMKAMGDDYRKIMKKLGFNLLIIPKSQNFADIYAEDYLDKYMPEEYVNILKKSKLSSTLQHLVPVLQKRIKWEEKERSIILAGVRGESLLSAKESMFDPLGPGELAAGYEIHRSLGLKEKDTLFLLGREFKVTRLESEKGTKEDITVWINLGVAQQLLKKEGKINGIMALECFCPMSIIETIRKDIAGLLPDVQVIEFSSEVVTRAEARARAERAAVDSLEAEKAHRQAMRAEKEDFASIYVPLIILASALWTGILMLSNVRERRQEIGVLRALGAGSFSIAGMFLLKACFIGLAGSLFGYLAGIAAGRIIAGAAGPFITYFDTGLFISVLVGTPLVAGAAALAPALLASAEDPAEILGQE
ncbi:MAG: FtsX-like permease family protein [Candidatus Firestonebacteria bacterium]